MVEWVVGRYNRGVIVGKSVELVELDDKGAMQELLEDHGDVGQ